MENFEDNFWIYQWKRLLLVPEIVAQALPVSGTLWVVNLLWPNFYNLATGVADGPSSIGKTNVDLYTSIFQLDH